MIERRGGQLDLTAIGQLAVQRNHLPQQLHLLVRAASCFSFSLQLLALWRELRQVLVELESQRMNPSQVRPALQVENVAVGKSLGGRGRPNRTDRPRFSYSSL